MPDIVLQHKTTEVFFLFPEYCELEREASAPYIHRMEYNYEEERPKFIEEFRQMLLFFRYEHNVTKYYDKKNLDGVLYPYQELEYPNVCNGVRAIMRDRDVLNWRDVLDKEDSVIEWHGMQVKDDTCAKVYERSQIDTPEMLVHATLFSIEDAIESDGMEFVFKQNNSNCSFSYCTTQRDLYTWLCYNRLPQRHYKYDSKHGENGINDGTRLPDGTPAAILYCSGEHAQELLCKAVGDVDIDENVWYYDVENQKIIYFEYQNANPQNEYHGFHLSPGDKRYDKVNIDLLRQIMDDIPC